MLKIGEKIKELRKAQDITQEKLADYLNISYQAVSKWENGLALPDITLLPQLADFFGVSADELLGITNPEQTEELKQYEKQYFSLGRKGKVLDKIELSREVLKKYPRNYQWMINLAYALVSYGATKEQLDVLATGKENFEEWNRSLQEHYSIVAVDNENIVGFGDIDKDGYEFIKCPLLLTLKLKKYLFHLHMQFLKLLMKP